MAGIDYSKDYNTLINSVGVGCESPANSAKGCGVKDCYLCNSWGNHSSVVSEQSYKDSLAAKNDIAREEIDTDFAQRNADLKDYVQPLGNTEASRRELTRWMLAHESDGFYGVVPKTNAGLLAVLDIYKRLVRDLTDVVINRAGE